MPGTVIRLVSLFSTINISKGHDIQSSQEDTLGQVNSNQSGVNRRHVGPHQQQQGPHRQQQRHPNGRPHGRQHRHHGQHQGEQRRQQGPPQGATRPRRRRTSQAARIQANRRVPAHLHQHAQRAAHRPPVHNHHPAAEQPPSYSQAMGGLSIWDLLRSECANVNNGEYSIDPFNLAGLFPLQNLHGFQDQQAGPQVHQEGQRSHGEDCRQGPGQRHAPREHGDGSEAMAQPRSVHDRLSPRRQDGQHVDGQDGAAGTNFGEAGAAASGPSQDGRQSATSSRRGTPSRQRRRERRARLRAAASSSNASSPPPRTPRSQSPRPDSEQGGPQNSVLELDESLLRDLEALFPERGGGGTDAETPEERERGILTLRAEADGAAESRTRRDQGWR